MRKFFINLVYVVWFIDVLNFPQFKFLDTTYPINGFGWFLIFIFLDKIKSESPKNNKINKNTSDCNNCKYRDFYVSNKDNSNYKDSVIVDVDII